MKKSNAYLHQTYLSNVIPFKAVWHYSTENGKLLCSGVCGVFVRLDTFGIFFLSTNFTMSLHQSLEHTTLKTTGTRCSLPESGSIHDVFIIITLWIRQYFANKNNIQSSIKCKIQYERLCLCNVPKKY